MHQWKKGSWSSTSESVEQLQGLDHGLSRWRLQHKHTDAQSRTRLHTRAEVRGHSQTGSWIVARCQCPELWAAGWPEPDSSAASQEPSTRATSQSPPLTRTQQRFTKCHTLAQQSSVLQLRTALTGLQRCGAELNWKSFLNSISEFKRRMQNLIQHSNGIKLTWKYYSLYKLVKKKVNVFNYIYLIY